MKDGVYIFKRADLLCLMPSPCYQFFIPLPMESFSYCRTGGGRELKTVEKEKDANLILSQAQVQVEYFSDLEIVLCTMKYPHSKCSMI